MKVCGIVCLVACYAAAVQGWVQPMTTTTNVVGRRRSTHLSMGVLAPVKRFRDSILNKERSRDELKIGIAGFYDRSSKLWEDVWGEVSSKNHYHESKA